jgi:hypothetical protein
MGNALVQSRAWSSRLAMRRHQFSKSRGRREGPRSRHAGTESPSDGGRQLNTLGPHTKTAWQYGKKGPEIKRRKIQKWPSGRGWSAGSGEGGLHKQVFDVLFAFLFLHGLSFMPWLTHLAEDRLVHCLLFFVWVVCCVVYWVSVVLSRRATDTWQRYFVVRIGI